MANAAQDESVNVNRLVIVSDALCGRRTDAEQGPPALASGPAGPRHALSPRRRTSHLTVIVAKKRNPWRG